MKPDQLKAWIATAVQLTNAGIAVKGFLEGWIGEAQPNLTPEDRRKAYEDVIADDEFRAAFSRRVITG